MNKQSNLYTVIYIIVLVVVVGAALAFTSLSLRDRQQENVNADKMGQILASVHIPTDRANVTEKFKSVVIEQYIINSRGERVEGNAFDVDVAAQVKLKDNQRQLPVYVCRTGDDNSLKYVLPMYGAGLWGPIWGYIAMDSDGATVYGAFFAHQGETPGLGAEIEKPAFSDQFDGKSMMKDNEFTPVAVIKKGQKPGGNEDYVDGISGGTITSTGVSNMIANSLRPYQAFLKSLNTSK